MQNDSRTSQQEREFELLWWLDHYTHHLNQCVGEQATNRMKELLEIWKDRGETPANSVRARRCDNLEKAARAGVPLEPTTLDEFL
jgi:hypothetical protein